jgi:deoxyribonuclease (pyrimidine dimer)
LSQISTTFCLNRGHESFFRDKILYLSKRSDALYAECLKRGIKAEDYSDCYKDIPPHLFNDWRETKEARELLKERINLRLTESKQKIRFYDRVVTLEEALIK